MAENRRAGVRPPAHRENHPSAAIIRFPGARRQGPSSLVGLLSAKQELAQQPIAAQPRAPLDFLWSHRSYSPATRATGFAKSAIRLGNDAFLNPRMRTVPRPGPDRPSDRANDLEASTTADPSRVAVTPLDIQSNEAPA